MFIFKMWLFLEPQLAIMNCANSKQTGCSYRNSGRPGYKKSAQRSRSRSNKGCGPPPDYAAKHSAHSCILEGLITFKNFGGRVRTLKSARF